MDKYAERVMFGEDHTQRIYGGGGWDYIGKFYCERCGWSPMLVLGTYDLEDFQGRECGGCGWYGLKRFTGKETKEMIKKINKNRNDRGYKSW